MIGIDIVDLSDPLLQGRERRAFKMISHPIDNSISHPHLFWLLWTAKEAVFKARREIVPFAPNEIPIKLEQKPNGLKFECGELKGSFEITDSCILAVVGKTAGSATIKVFNEDSGDWSTLIRKKLTMHLGAEKLSVKISQDSNGIPILTPGSIPVSFTHHGKFGAFAYPSSF